MQGDFGDYYFRSGTSFVAVEIKGTSRVGRPALMPPPTPTATPPRPARETDEDFTRCYEQQMGPLVRHLMRQGAAPHEAAEAAQAAFAEALTRWPLITHPPAWLRRVAYRQYLRRPAREEPVADIPDLPGGVCPLTAVQLREEEARVYAALAGLPPLQRRVLAWVLDGFETAEIGRILDMTEAAVRQNLCRARARLKQLLLNERDGGGR
ncbi:sigma-70 family RNA polymerase sigma factor [Streptomyces sp. NPDC050439]|uniref:RNA polymerase sigma factor n=1 Tax=unclassified Streptomyces TaxID=2593676 RepID=UPI0034158BD3